MSLLVVGGMALFRALTSGPATPGSARPTTSVGGQRASSTEKADSTPSRPPTLQIKVVGSPTDVYVAVPGNTTAGLRQHGVLATGEIRQYDDPRLVVVVDDASAVEVRINGKLQAKGAPGERMDWNAVRE